MKAVETNAATLQEHMARTYLDLRIGIAVIGAVLPILLWAGGALLERRPLLYSMSNYYYTGMRDVFVGALVAIGLFLYLYKGFSSAENRALNLAGTLAVGIAFVPTIAPDGAESLGTHLHDIFAITFFLSIAYVAVFRAADTLSLIEDEQRARRMRAMYRSLGGLMLASPLVAVVLSYILQPHARSRSIVFFVEAMGVWAFAAYWMVKSREIAETDAELLALAGKVQAVPVKEPKATGRMVRVA